jgi:hypothetical protein
MKYDTLKQFHDAVKAGQESGAVLWIDNDTTDAINEDEEELFSMHPADLLEQALDLLGIPHEHV